MQGPVLDEGDNPTELEGKWGLDGTWIDPKLLTAGRKVAQVFFSQSKHCTVVFSRMSMQSFRGVSGVTPQDEETAIREMFLKRTGLVDKHGLADALRGMGQSEREIQQLLASISVNVVPPTAGSKVTVPILRKAHDLPVSLGKVDSGDEESLDYTSDVSIIDEMGPVSSKTFRKLGTRTRQVPRCWHGSRCPWQRRGRCLFQHNEVSGKSRRGREELQG